MHTPACFDFASSITKASLTAICAYKASVCSDAQMHKVPQCLNASLRVHSVVESVLLPECPNTADHMIAKLWFKVQNATLLLIRVMPESSRQHG